MQRRIRGKGLEILLWGAVLIALLAAAVALAQGGGEASRAGALYVWEAAA